MLVELVEEVSWSMTVSLSIALKRWIYDIVRKALFLPLASVPM
jgi:hypothetical protein